MLAGVLVWLGAGAWPVLGAPAAKPWPRPFRVVTTTAMVRDLVEGVAGTNARVTALFGEGVDPHLYRPTRDDMARLLQADVVVYSGLMLEGRMTDTFLKLGRRGQPVLAVGELLEGRYRLVPKGAGGHADPHVWMDVSAWAQAARELARALGRLDPPQASAYEAGAARYAAQLEELDAHVRAAVASVPRERRVLITAHDAFGYFGRAYDIEVRGVQGLSTESEAGVADINRLVDFIVRRKIPALFVETSVSDKNIRALMEGCRARGHTVAIGGSLFSDAMGAPGTYEGTYPGMIDHNVTRIVRALGGQAPARGRQGRLSTRP
jgi:manganese/zinc/iron transport system substrate-binding protein